MTEWYSTGVMIADFMTKPLQSSLFWKFQYIIMGANQHLTKSEVGTKSAYINGLVKG